MSLLAPFDAACAAPDAAVRASALPAVGYLANTVPVEMIRAAGCFAQQVTGSPADDTPDALRHMEPFFSGAVLSIFQRYLDGRLSHLSALLIPRSCEEFLQLYYHAIARRGPDRPEPILFDILHTPYDTTRRYNAGRLLRLRDRLAEIGGGCFTDCALSEAVAEADGTRDLLAQLNHLRIGAKARLTGAEMLRITRASTLMAPTDFSAAAQGLLDQADALAVRDGLRVLLTGSGHDTDGFHRLTEAPGATVVADDHASGDWWHLDPVGDGDPMDAMLTKYHLNAPSPRTFPRARHDMRLLAAAERSRAQAAIFFTWEWDDTLGFDIPTQRALLAERGIPSVFLKEQSYRHPDRDAQASAVEDLLKTLSQPEAVR